MLPATLVFSFAALALTASAAPIPQDQPGEAAGLLPAVDDGDLLARDLLDGTLFDDPLDDLLNDILDDDLFYGTVLGHLLERLLELVVDL